MNKSGIGVVIWNSQGLVLASLSQKVQQVFSPSEVEALVAKRAIQFTSKLDITSAVLEGDSQVLMLSLQSGAEFLTPYGLLLEDVRLVSNSFNELCYFHDKRKSNKIAYSLTRFAINVSDFFVWIKMFHRNLFLYFRLI